jgi:four helix bundle protein
MKDNNKIKERACEFAIDIIRVAKKMPSDTAGFVLGRQLMRSGTSIGANVEEATGAFSKDDFIFKMNIALKEAREAHYSLRLAGDSGIDERYGYQTYSERIGKYKEYSVGDCENVKGKEIELNRRENS